MWQVTSDRWQVTGDKWTHVTCAREHYRSYHLAMRKTVRGTTRSSSSSTREEEGPADAEEGSSWMADHAMLVHGGTSSADPTQDYEFLVLGSNQKHLYRQLEESVRIKTPKTKSILILGRGNRRKTVRGEISSILYCSLKLQFFNHTN